MNRSAAAFMQYRFPVGLGPSLNTAGGRVNGEKRRQTQRQCDSDLPWPRCAPDRASITSTRGMKGKELSDTSITCSGSMGAQKDGQPVLRAERGGSAGGVIELAGCSHQVINKIGKRHSVCFLTLSCTSGPKRRAANRPLRQRRRPCASHREESRRLCGQ
jgi:hypothetical protein